MIQHKTTAKFYDLSDDKFAELIRSSYTYLEILRSLQLTVAGGNYATVKARIARLNLDISHFDPHHYVNPRKRVYNLYNDILVENCTVHHATQLIRQSGILGAICFSCGTGTSWNGKPLSLQVHHINGISNDNRVKNLELLCPNCHTQTNNYGARNTSRIKHCCLQCKKLLNVHQNYFVLVNVVLIIIKWYIAG